MNKSLLICIAFHYVSKRVKYLIQVINNFRYYYGNVDIIVDTNTEDFYNMVTDKTKVFVHPNLEHPFHLTWMHRQHMKDNIDKYDVFFYCEDDILLPFENYLNYLENFHLYPMYVPSFIRVEIHNGEEYVADIHEKQELKFMYIGHGKEFALLKPLGNYHGFWIMPQKELKESMKEDFVKLSDGREFAASYTNWTLGKQTLVEIEDNKVSKKCYSYHLPNNAPFVNLKVEDIFT